MEKINDILPGDIAIYDWSDEKSSVPPPPVKVCIMYVFNNTATIKFNSIVEKTVPLTSLKKCTRVSKECFKAKNNKK
jgi:hypothetical protein